MHEVWITGIGCLSALGEGFDCHRDAARRARGGITTHSVKEFASRTKDTLTQREQPGTGRQEDCGDSRDRATTISQPCGVIPANILTDDANKTACDRATRLLRSAFFEALAQARVVPGSCADVILGTTLGNMHGSSRYYFELTQGTRPDPKLIGQAIMHAPSKTIIREADIRGKVMTVSSACASGAIALGHAFRRVRAGRSSMVIAGGFDALSAFVIAGFRSLRLVSNEVCRPFDRDRDGLTPGEGAAVLVLESAESARARGVEPLARMIGFGEALEAYHHTRAHPQGKGLESAMGRALGSAEIGPSEISAAHLHGTATQANDLSEYMAVRTIFGSSLSELAVYSTKSMTGHTFGAAGALSAVLSISTIVDGVVPATLYHSRHDPAFEGLNITSTPRTLTQADAVMMTALGFGGEAACCIFGRVDS